MKQIPVRSLKPTPRLDGSLFTLERRPVIAATHPLTQGQIEAMSKAGIDVVLKVALNESPDKFMHNREAVAVASLHVNHPAPEDLFDDGDRLLIGAGQKITEETMEQLSGLGLKVLFAHHDPDEKRYLRFIEAATLSMVEALDRTLAQEPEALRIQPKGVPALRSIRIWHGNRRPHKTTDQMMKNYRLALQQMSDILSVLRQGQMLARPQIDTLLGGITALLCEDKDLALNLPTVTITCDHLVKHSVDVAMLSAAIGMYMNYNPTQLAELAEAALLHDIGMIEVPEATLSKTSPLTSGEKQRIQKHTLYGLRVLHRIQTESSAVPLAIHQSHERESGQGYPNNRTTHQIHDFARVVAIADVYQALIQPRPHRHGLHPIKAMESLLKMNKIGLLDKEALMAFGRANGGYPIGSFVSLPGGETARVVASNENDMFRPRLSVLLDNQGRRSPSNQFMQMGPDQAQQINPCSVDAVKAFTPFQGF